MARCEWNPAKNEAALLGADEECFNEATVSLGNGKWHVCDSCAALPRFAEFKEHRRLHVAHPATPADGRGE